MYEANMQVMQAVLARVLPLRQQNPIFLQRWLTMSEFVLKKGENSMP
jgi:hypothetical protein